jgi:hypothetical protein
MIDLMKFCYPDESYHDIHKPWLSDGVVYATDGKICVAVKPERTTTEYQVAPPPGGKKFRDVKHLFDFRRSFVDVPCGVIPDCEKCKNKYVVNAKCVWCRGFGLAECNMGHEHECDQCDGGFDEINCGCVMEIGGLHFRSMYINKIYGLPNLRFKIADNAVLWFEFDGGVGLLSPVKMGDK